MERTKNEREGSGQAIDNLSAAIKAVQEAQEALQLFMKERKDKNLANMGLMAPMRDLKGVESKLKTYVKN